VHVNDVAELDDRVIRERMRASIARELSLPRDLDRPRELPADCFVPLQLCVPGALGAQTEMVNPSLNSIGKDGSQEAQLSSGPLGLNIATDGAFVYWADLDSVML